MLGTETSLDIMLEILLPVFKDNNPIQTSHYRDTLFLQHMKQEGKTR